MSDDYEIAYKEFVRACLDLSAAQGRYLGISITVAEIEHQLAETTDLLRTALDEKNTASRAFDDAFEKYHEIYYGSYPQSSL